MPSIVIICSDALLDHEIVYHSWLALTIIF